MESWQQFIIQLFVTLVPVAIALIKQNRRITILEQENVKLKKDNKDLSDSLETLKLAHIALQGRYEHTLLKQAGMRDKF